jgi:hypothetical protein
MVPLGEVLRQVVDAYPVHADQTYPTFGVYGFGRGLFDKTPILGATIKAQRLYKTRNGHFVYSRLKAFEGAYALVTEEFDGHYVSNEFPTFEALTERLLPEYVAAYFRSPSIWKSAAQLSEGLGARRDPSLGDLQLIVVGRFGSRQPQSRPGVERILKEHHVCLYAATEVDRLVEENRRTAKDVPQTDPDGPAHPVDQQTRLRP